MMNLPVTQLTHDQLIATLRSALHYLYDPVHLRDSPLVTLLELDAHFDQANALQAKLTAAIRTLKPEAAEAPQSRAWRIYDILHFQYIRQLSRTAVADQLGISSRQLRREQRVALEVLAQQLLPHLDPEELLGVADAAPVTAQPVATPTEEAAATDQALNTELRWLNQSTSEAPIALSAALATVLQLVRPLAARWQVALELDIAPALADHPVPPLLLRTILPTVLNVAMPRAGGQPLTIAADQVGRRLLIHIRGAAHQPQAPLRAKERAGLQTAQSLAQFHGAELITPTQATTGFVTTLALPGLTPIPVLVIDDNADWLALQQRYVVGSPYQITGTSDSVHAPALAAQRQPSLILLDVMMHQVDGWQILSELRHQPATATIPVVICTILPVAELALSLGATAFLQKPVTQEQYLRTLAQWVAVAQ